MTELLAYKVDTSWINVDLRDVFEPGIRLRSFYEYLFCNSGLKWLGIPESWTKLCVSTVKPEESCIEIKIAGSFYIGFRAYEVCFESSLGKRFITDDLHVAFREWMTTNLPGEVIIDPPTQELVGLGINCTVYVTGE